LRDNWRIGKRPIERVEKAIVAFLDKADNLNSTARDNIQREETVIDCEAHTMEISSSLSWTGS
jgi:hypothetical protein